MSTTKDWLTKIVIDPSLDQWKQMMRHQDPVLWGWLEFFFLPKRSINKQKRNFQPSWQASITHLSPVISFWLNTLKGILRAPPVDLLRLNTKTAFLNRKRYKGSKVPHLAFIRCILFNSSPEQDGLTIHILVFVQVSFPGSSWWDSAPITWWQISLNGPFSITIWVGWLVFKT